MQREYLVCNTRKIPQRTPGFWFLLHSQKDVTIEI